MSLMNHSCDPNVITVFEGSRLCVRSLRPIRAGEELLQCYTDETCDVLLRRKKLLEQYHFLCECQSNACYFPIPSVFTDPPLLWAHGTQAPAASKNSPSTPTKPPATPPASPGSKPPRKRSLT